MSSARLDMTIEAHDSASGALNRVASAANKLGKAQGTVARGAKSHNTAFTTMRRAAIGLATSYAAIKIGRFAKESIQAASGLQEAINANSVVFKQNASEVAAWAKTSAVSFGQSERQALVAAKTFGTFGTAAGLSGKKLARFSTDLVELSSDLASFHDTSIEEAITAVGSGLGGEMEAMRRRYGVLLDAATLKSRAVKMGLMEEGEQLSQTNKILAAHREIMIQTKEEAGDFQRTQGDWANQTRTLGQQYENLKAAVGAPLMNALTPVVQMMNDAMPGAIAAIQRAAPGLEQAFGGFVRNVADKLPGAFERLQREWPQIQSAFVNLGKAAQTVGKVFSTAFDMFGSLPPGVQTAIVKLSALAMVFGKLRGIMGGLGLASMVGNFSRMGAGAGMAGQQVGRLSSAMRGLQTAGVVAAGALVAYEMAMDDVNSHVADGITAQADLRNYLQQGADALDLFNRPVEPNLPIWAQRSSAEVRTLGDEIGRMNDGALQSLGRALQGNPFQAFSTFFGAQGEIEAIRGEVESMVTAFTDLGQTDPGAAAAGLQQIFDQLRNAGMETSQIENLFGDLQAQINQLKVDAGEIDLVPDDQVPKMIRATDAQRRFTAAQRDYQAAARNSAQVARAEAANKTAFSVASNKAENALRQEAQAARQAVSAMVASGRSQKDASATAKQLAGSLRSSAQQLGISEKQAEKLARSILKIPKKAKTDTSAPGAKKAGKELDDVTRAARNADKQKPKTNTSAPGARKTKGELDNVTGAAKDADKQSPSISVTTSAPAATTAIRSAIGAAREADGIHSVITIETRRITTGGGSGGGGGGSWATGGQIVGPGTSTSDSILARVSDGEFIQRAAAVSKYGLSFMNALNMGAIDPDELPAYAKGGKVRATRKGKGKGKNKPKPNPAGRRAAQKIRDKMGRQAAKKPWFDERWADYNKPPSIPPKPKPGKGKKARDRLKDWKRDKRDALKDWRDTLRREDLDWKWKLRDEAERKREEERDRRERERQDRLDDEERKREDDKRRREDEQEERQREREQEQEEQQRERERIAEEAEREEERRQMAIDSAVESLRGGVINNAGSVSRFASVTGYDLSRAAQDQEQAKLARIAVGSARSAAARQEAVKAAREASLQAAQSAVTPTNVRRWMSDKLNTLKSFRSALGKLASKGLHPVTLAEVGALDPESGLQMANALLASDLASMNTLQNQINAESVGYGIGQFGRDVRADQITSDLTSQMIMARTGSGNVQVAVDLYLDGEQIDSSLQRLQQRRGEL